MTPEGIPYVDFTSLVNGRSLEPGQATDSLILTFHNPSRIQFTYRLVFFGHLNEAPAITTVPAVNAEEDRPYRYDIDAFDPDNDPLTFTLVVGPGGMTVDAASGQISWSFTR